MWEVLTHAVQRSCALLAEAAKVVKVSVRLLGLLSSFNSLWNLQEAKKVVFPMPDHSAEDDEQKVCSSFPSLFAQCFCDLSQREQLEALAKQERDLLIHTVFRFLAALTDEVCLPCAVCPRY